jgi:hypothetical protein
MLSESNLNINPKFRGVPSQGVEEADLEQGRSRWSGTPAGKTGAGGCVCSDESDEEAEKHWWSALTEDETDDEATIAFTIILRISVWSCWDVVATLGSKHIDRGGECMCGGETFLLTWLRDATTSAPYAPSERCLEALRDESFCPDPLLPDLRK